MSAETLFDNIDNNPEEDWPGGIKTTVDLYDFGNKIDMPIEIKKIAKKFINKNRFLCSRTTMMLNNEKSFSIIMIFPLDIKKWFCFLNGSNY
jgi:hypothetical protein